MTENTHTQLARTNALLKELLLRQTPHPGKYSTPVDGMAIIRHDDLDQSDSCFSNPLVGLVVQGSKFTVIGSEEYVYGENQCVVSGVDMPSSFRVMQATPQRPFLAVSLDLDRQLITRLAAETPPPSGADNTSPRGTYVADVEPETLSAFLRLVELINKPEQIRILAPMLIQEIHYRLLIGPQGERLRKLSTLGSQSNQIAQAISWLRGNYKGPLRIEQLARKVNMATSTFHRHFKEVTSISPLQFHKRLRLHEAQRLMLTENTDAASTALAVGYESPTQFNREYKRLFGEPPHRDVMRLR